MTEPVALDTNIIIDFFNNDPQITERIYQTPHLCIPAPVYGEFLIGIRRAGRADLFKAAHDEFFKSTIPLSVDEDVAVVYADLNVSLRASGTMIPVNDFWIAACCLVHHVPLATRDTHFKRIPALKTLDW